MKLMYLFRCCSKSFSEGKGVVAEGYLKDKNFF
jgi:cytochrome c-type biogenesis protein CcmE